MQSQELPSTLALAKATMIALLGATAILVTVVLPAEYGIDPLGTGGVLGLTGMSRPVSASPSEERFAGATAVTPAVEGPLAHHSAEYKVDSAEFKLGPYEYVEYKYRLEKGASMLYSWAASSDVVHDLHGQPNGDPRPPEQSFDKRTRRQAHGALTAPFSGVHGWYWENLGGETVTVTLTTAGFSSAAQETRIDGTSVLHELKSIGRPPAGRVDPRPASR